jgi:hypothetical protein
LSLVAEILDRLSGVAVLKERLAETNRNVDRSLTWLLDHEKRLIHLEAAMKVAQQPPASSQPRLPRK